MTGSFLFGQVVSDRLLTVKDMKLNVRESVCTLYLYVLVFSLFVHIIYLCHESTVFTRNEDYKCGLKCGFLSFSLSGEICGLHTVSYGRLSGAP